MSEGKGNVLSKQKNRGDKIQKRGPRSVLQKGGLARLEKKIADVRTGKVAKVTGCERRGYQVGFLVEESLGWGERELSGGSRGHGELRGKKTSGSPHVKKRGCNKREKGWPGEHGMCQKKGPGPGPNWNCEKKKESKIPGGKKKIEVGP